MDASTRQHSKLGIDSGSDGRAQVDDGLTAAVIAATGSKADARLRQLMPLLVRHLHAFARETGLTVDEWFAGVDIQINRCGQMSDEKRNETQLLCDVLGLESLVVDADATRLHAPALRDTTNRPSGQQTSLKPTPSTVLGPFYRANAPLLPQFASIVLPNDRDNYMSSTTHISGRVLDTAGNAVSGALLDVWHTAPNGMYEQQDPGQPDMDLRGRFVSRFDGRYSFRCLRPVSYPIPSDGPVGQLLDRLGRHPNRPAHVHFIVTAPGFRTLTTQLFDATDKWLADDAVFAVKNELKVQFKPCEGESNYRWAVEYDFVLAGE